MEAWVDIMDNKFSDKKGLIQRAYVQLNNEKQAYRFAIFTINIGIIVLIFLFVISILSFFEFVVYASFFLMILFGLYEFGMIILFNRKTNEGRLESNTDTSSSKSINDNKIRLALLKFMNDAYPSQLIDYFIILRNKDFYKPNRKDITLFILLLIVATSLLYLPSVIDNVVQHYEQSGYFKKLADSIVVGDSDNYSKVISIINWQKSNIKNIWGIDNSIGIFYPPNIGLWFSKFPPQIIIRPGGPITADWALITKYGMCGEESQAFMDLASLENVPVRSISLVGADHGFDEVYINGSWKTVDVTNNMNNSYDIPYGFYEKSIDENGWGYTIAYVNAQYPNGTQEVVTDRYAQVSNVTIKVLNTNNQPVQNATVNVYLNNNGQQSTAILNNTSANGLCTFTLGIGKYVFEANNGSYTGSQGVTLSPNNDTELVIKLDNPVKSNLFNSNGLLNNTVFVEIFGLIGMIIASYIVVLLAKFLNNRWVYMLLFGILAYAIIDVALSLILIYVSV
jgi:hypothetical protein